MMISFLSKYLDTLPNGLASYPDCCVKGSVVRHVITTRRIEPQLELPPPLRALVDNPPTVTEWVPEVLHIALLMAVREAHADLHNTEDYLAWVYDQNRKLFGTVLYRALFLLISPERLLTGVEKRWGTFRRGTTFRIVTQSAGQAEARLQCPPFLYPSIGVLAIGKALQAALDSAGARSSRLDATARSSTEITFSLRWQ